VVAAQVTRLSFAVMAHLDRLEQARRLADQLGASLAVDSGGLGENANGDVAWTLHDEHADWHVVLQDDAQPVDGFAEHAAAALEHAPRTAVSFYVGTGRPRQESVERAVHVADATDVAWLTHPTLLWGVAVAMPTEHVAPFLAWARSNRLPYDRRIGAYWQRARIPVRYTWPSLVDHADGPSLLRHPWGPPKAPRRAWRLGTPARWDTEAVMI
jgi:hypothetical protein